MPTARYKNSNCLTDLTFPSRKLPPKTLQDIQHIHSIQSCKTVCLQFLYPPSHTPHGHARHEYTPPPPDRHPFMLLITLAINCLFTINRRKERNKRGPSLDAVVKHLHDFFVVLKPPLFLQPSVGQAIQLVDRRDERGVCRLRLREKERRHGRTGGRQFCNEFCDDSEQFRLDSWKFCVVAVLCPERRRESWQLCHEVCHESWWL